MNCWFFHIWSQGQRSYSQPSLLIFTCFDCGAQKIEADGQKWHEVMSDKGRKMSTPDFWLVVISEQDGTGGGKNVRYRFATYDDAHAFYRHIKSLAGTSFHPSVIEPPRPVTLKGPRIYKKGDMPWGIKG